MATETTIKTYTWWDEVPENLGTMTRLGKEKLKPGGPVRALIEYGKGRRHRVYDLYDRTEAVAKVASPAQLAALEKARIATRTCSRCAAVVEKPSDLGKRTGRCIECRVKAAEAKRAREVDATIEWARRMLADPDALILDTETTDLYGYICEIAVIRMDGSVVLDTLVNPEAHNSATEIHRITREMTWSAPTFADIEPELRRLLHGRTVVVYNAMFDSSVLEREISRMCTLDADAETWLHDKDHTLSIWARQPFNVYWRLREHEQLVQSHSWWWRERVTWECAMDAYAYFVGEPRGYKRGYKWQPLRGGHRARGDCLACLQRIQRMAATPLSTEHANDQPT